jgi:dephospho-coA kinase
MPSSRVVEVLRALIVELADLVRRRRAARAGLGRLSVPRGDRVLRVGLTGGIGSGKSTVARLLAARGASIVDADAIAREVVEPGTPGLSEVVEAFGPTILTGDGALDRAALAERVFGDPGDRSRLEAITLPRIAQVAAHRMEEAGPGGVAVYDVPLLVEQAMEDLFDCVLVIETPPVLRLARLQSRGLSRQETDRRMAGQADDEERRRVADVLLLNNGTETDLADGVDWLWEHRIAVGIPAGRTSGR